MGLTLENSETNFGKDWEIGTNNRKEVGLTLEKSGTNFWQLMGLTFGNQWDYPKSLIIGSRAKRETRMMAR